MQVMRGMGLRMALRTALLMALLPACCHYIQVFASVDGLVRGSASKSPQVACSTIDLKPLDEAYNHQLFEANETGGDFNYRQSEDYEKANGENGVSARTYGEILPAGVVSMFCKAQELVGSLSSRRFYDLGSGAGKLTMIMWYLGMHASGVELNSVRTEHACGALGRLTPIPRMQDGTLSFFGGSMFDVDWSDADVIFTDSIVFTPAMLSRLEDMSCRLKQGTLVINNRKWPGSQFKLLHAMELQASWGKTPIFIQKLVAPHPCSDTAQPATGVLSTPSCTFRKGI